MPEIRVELNPNGIRELLKSPEVAGFCEKQAERLTRATGVEYTPDVHIGRNRANAGGYDATDDE